MTHPTPKLFASVRPKLPGCWHEELTFEGRSVGVDLTIDGDTVGEAELAQAFARAQDLATLDAAARGAIRADAARGEDSELDTYLEHHREELQAEDLRRIFGSDDPSEIDLEALLSHLFLVRLGLYPEHRQLVADYSIDPEVTNYVVCVRFDGEGAVTSITVES